MLNPQLVRVQSISLSIHHLTMVVVRQTLKMGQQVQCLLLHVRIGSIRMVSKIIHSIVCFIFPFRPNKIIVSSF
jgi:hypothetical protein